MQKESDFVGLSKALNKTTHTQSPLEEDEDVNEAARRFLQAHHEQTLFKAKELIEKGRTKVNENIKDAGTQPAVENNQSLASAVATTEALASGSNLIKNKIKQTFSSAQIREINLRAVNRIRTPSLQTQLASLAIDLACVFLSAVVLMALYVAALEPAFRTQIIVPQHWDFADRLLFGGIFKASFVLSLVIYPIASFFISGRTVGQKTLGLKVVRYGQYTCSASDIVLRSLNLPLSLIMLGFVPIFFGKRPLHDLAAGTALTRD
jgi:uncharacterized RDD family membrane protein YckC